jgi:predicted nucleotidyltransferase
MTGRSSPPTIDQLRAILPAFCRRHEIARAEIFGSLARGEAHAGSDVDIMVTFRPGVRPGLDFFGLQEELSSLLGCEVDLVTRRSIEAGSNPIRRRSILESVREVYAG